MLGHTYLFAFEATVDGIFISPSPSAIFFLSLCPSFGLIRL